MNPEMTEKTIDKVVEVFRVTIQGVSVGRLLDSYELFTASPPLVRTYGERKAIEVLRDEIKRRIGPTE